MIIPGVSAVNLAPLPATDDYYDDTALLLNFQGANGSSTFTDLSPDANGISNTGSPTVQDNKLSLNGSSHIYTDDSDILRLNTDFTLELFGVTFDSLAAVAPIISKYSASANDRVWQILYDDAFTVLIARFFTNGSSSGSSVTTSYVTDLDVDTPYNICWERSGTTLRLYLGGVMVDSVNAGSSVPDTNLESVRIGADESGGIRRMTGDIDAIRITEGVARYATDGSYTVPSTPLPTTQTP